MRFAVDRKLFHKAFTAAGRVVGRTSPLPVLHNLCIEATPEGLVLTGTNLEVGIEMRVMAEVEEPGTITLSVKTLGDWLGGLTAEALRFDSGENTTAQVTCGKSRCTLYGLPASDYPSLPGVGAGVSFALPQEELVRILRSVLHAAAEDMTRPILGSVCLRLEGDRLDAVATDTHCLAIRSASVKEPTGDGTALIPSTSLTHLLHVLEGDAESDVEVRYDQNQALFQIPTAKLICRKVEGTYLAYQDALPKKFEGQATLDRGELLGALKRAAALADADGKQLLFSVEEGRILIRSRSAGVGDAEEEVAAEMTGPEVQKVFYAPTLLPAIAAVDTDRVILDVNPGVKPLQIRPEEGDSFRQVVQVLSMKES